MTIRRGFTLDFRASADRPEKPENASSATPGRDTTADGEKPLTVSQLTRRIKSLLEGQFPAISVEGEIGSLSRPPSGHLYLTLKDGNAALDAVLWKSAAGRLSFTPREGDRIIARGELSVYEPRGRYQMTISSLRRAGEGDQLAALRELVAKLREEGLFDPARKRPLPPMPALIGMVTSASGAAVRDIIKVARKRWPGVRLILSPCLVQGKDAPQTIMRALANLESMGNCDLIILGRGGGSLEDLAAFNNEALARAVSACTVPVISAVGHEVDVSLCDLVADARAATPSEAAEMAVPDVNVYRERLERLRRQLTRALTGPLQQARLRLRALAQSAVLRKPENLLRTRRQRLDELAGELEDGGRRFLQEKRRRLELAAARLHGCSPLGTLARGYSVTRSLSADMDTPGELIRTAEQVHEGELLRTDLQAGYVVSRVERTGGV